MNKRFKVLFFWVLMLLCPGTIAVWVFTTFLTFFSSELWQTIHDFGIAHLGLMYMWAALMIGSGMILTGCMDSHYFDDIFEDE